MRRDIVLLGGGGHAKVLIELLRESGDYKITGIVDPNLEEEMLIAGVRILGDDSLLPGLLADGVMHACVALGSVRDNGKRKEVYELARKSGFNVPYLIHPKAIVSEIHTSVSEGAQVMKGAIVQAGCEIGQNTIINTGAIVEHDCKIGKHVHICPGAIICGGSTIGDNSFIGAGATVIQGIEIGRDTVIGAGSVILGNITEKVVIKGAP